MAPIELQDLCVQLEDLLGKGFIHPIVSLWGDLVVFGKKKYETLQICIDYKQLNKVIVKKRYPFLVLMIYLISFLVQLWFLRLT